MDSDRAKTGRSELNEFKSWVRESADRFVQRPEVTDDIEKFSKANAEQEVTPEMMVTDFYKGAAAEYKRQEYKPDPNLSRPGDKPRGWKVELDMIFSEMNRESPGSVVLVGPAGSGKTTSVKRFVRNNREEFNFVLQLEPSADTKSPVRLFNFLFPCHDGIAEDLLEKGYEWMLANPEKITFIIDSLDTIPFKLSEDGLISSSDGVHSPATILSSIMARKLFSSCRILASSREYGITEHPKSLRGDRIISLVGLTNESIHKHVNSVLEDEGKKYFFQNVERKHPGLWALLATPLFLVFTIIGYIKNTELLSEFIPSNMSGIMVRLLQNLFSSQHGVAMTQETCDVMNKLKKLSYNGILNGKVTFTEEDLKDSNLEAKEATALSISVPFPEKSSQRLRVLQGQNLLYFCHQCVQELFAALWIIQMNPTDFKSTIDTQMTKSEFSVVRRFLCGLLLNKEVYDAALKSHLLQEISKKKEIEEKRATMSEHLEQQLTQSRNDKPKRLELYISLHEAGEGAGEVIKANMKYLDLVGLKNCSVSDMHAIGAVVKYCDQLDHIDFSDCGLTPAKIESLDCGLEFDAPNKKIKVDKLRMKYNWDLQEEGMTKLGTMLSKFDINKFVLDGCKVTDAQMRCLGSALKKTNTKIKKLQLKELEGFIATDKMAGAISAILPQISRRVKLAGWDFTDDGVKCINDALKYLNSKDDEYRTDVKYGKDGDKFAKTESLEAVCMKVCKRFGVKGMREFAGSEDGLELPMTTTQDIRDDFKQNAAGEKQAYVNAWREKNGKRATAAKLREINDKYPRIQEP